MDTKSEYLASDRLRDIIDDNDLLLFVISRFSIPFGFGDETVSEVCASNNVDEQTFLAVANMIGNNRYRKYKVSLRSLVDYLRNAHAYFLDFNLPSIRKKLIEAINCTGTNDVQFLILKYFDDYMEEVRRHMEYENDIVFKYVDNLLEGKKSDDFDISDYSADHDDLGDKLNELKDIVIRHYQQRDNYMLNSVLYDIISCQKDLVTHCKVENDLFVPAVIRYEESLDEIQFNNNNKEDSETTADGLIHSVSEREKEIIRHVARGLSNKEIADAMCLSIHTVTTYRRNIAAKLQIHSPAGLTIFAIIHKLIDIKDIKLQ
ncbi:MAG: LuxR C-terminal-related transcriptional regulator [Candidatus Amulumruptor caecigallinarius]|nr:LuxR C-terminal-related transcriptional regulator [Candidatus Amulumruptor caecigallinarius]